MNQDKSQPERAPEVTGSERRFDALSAGARLLPLSLESSLAPVDYGEVGPIDHWFLDSGARLLLSRPISS